LKNQLFWYVKKMQFPATFDFQQISWKMRLFAEAGTPRELLIFFCNFDEIVLILRILAELMMPDGRKLPSSGPRLCRFAETAWNQGRIVGR